MKRGYFALWRKFQDHPFWKQPREFSKAEAWIDILWCAQHKEEPKEVIFNMTVITQHYGETLKSINTWANRWKWSESRVRRFFKLLEKMKQIRTKSEGITTRLTVINYDSYDPKRRVNDETSTSKRREADETSTTKKNVKKDNNEKNVKKTPLTPHEKIIELYHDLLPELATIRNPGNGIKKKILARWKADKERQNLEWWDWYFKGVRECDFLMGKKKDWAATLHWLLGPENMDKVLSGNFLNRDKEKTIAEEWVNERLQK